MQQFKKFFNDMCRKHNFIKRVWLVLIAVILMGFAISWLVPCSFGTDCYTLMNLQIASRLGLSFGTWQVILNIGLFIIVILFGREQIGIGTLANMLLVGYSCDFFTIIWNKLLPENFFESLSVRIIVVIPALLVFVIAAAIYMDTNLGTSPYDAIPFILAKRINKVPFKVIRITYDLLAILIGFLLGAKLMPITVAMAFLLGPAVEAVGKKMTKLM